MPAPDLYPLRFDPIYKEKVWGGRTLERLGRALPGGPEAKIGESWELADLATTSPSGGGGGAERSVIANGPLKGRTFRDAIQSLGRSLLGDLPLNEFDEFPLLVKFLDAAEHLSVQVHPSPDYAAQHPDAYLKSEAWYVLHAAPGACIYKGVQPGVTEAQFREAIRNHAVEPLLVRVPVQAGDCHYLPSGTCHALGAGVLAAEVQTPSDTTFRVYDWGRPRKLHVEEALACIDFSQTAPAPARPVRIAGPCGTIDRLVDCPFFRIDRVQLPAGATEPLHHRQPRVWMVLAGHGDITRPNGRDEMRTGHTFYLPPKMTRVTLTTHEPVTLLEVSFPQAESGVIASSVA